MKLNITGKRIAGLVLWVLLLLAVVAVVVLGSLKAPPDEAPTIDEKAVLIRAAVIAAQTIPDTMLVPGRVLAAADVVVSAEKAGTVVALHVDRGDAVKKGQELLAVDDSLWRAVAQRSEIEVREAEKDLARWERLKQSGAVSDSDYDAIRTRLDVGRVTLDEAKLNVAKCRLVAPVTGQVDERFIEEGEYANEGQPVLRIVDMSSLKVTAEVPEREIAAVGVGQNLVLSVAALGNCAVTGRVAFVANSGRIESNCFPVQLVVQSPPPGLKPGMIVELELVRRVWNEAVVLPLSAVVPRKGDHIVFVVEDVEGQLRATSRVIRIKRILGDRALVESGVGLGERLVVAGQRTLQDGQLVEVSAD